MVCGVAVPKTADAGEAAAAQPRSGLYSNDEKVVMEYLKTHRIPNQFIHAPSQPYPPPDLREITRAVDLFKSGSQELRLSIAQSMPAGSHQGMQLWEMCDDQNFEARHYLVGLAVEDAESVQRGQLREWLLNNADPGYAAALLKNLRFEGLHHLYDDSNEAQVESVIGFLKSLYRQTGRVVIRRILPGDGYGEELGGSVQQYVVKLLPVTAQGASVLLDWISCDSKKVDQPTLNAMWHKWNRCKFNDLAAVSKRRDVAESWLLSSIDHRELYNVDKTEFNRNLCRQLFNPDPQVRQKALEYVIRLGTLSLMPEGKRSDSLNAIRAAFATKKMRAKVWKEAKGVVQEQFKTFAANQRTLAYYETLWQDLSAAILPKDSDPVAGTDKQ